LRAKQALLGWLACAGLALGGGGIAMATAVPGEIVTGQIVTINGNMINVGGQTFPIAAGSAAYAAVTNFKPGQVVDVQLDGPAKSSSSHAINITLHWQD
jgi:hypothetical protein